MNSKKTTILEKLKLYTKRLKNDTYVLVLAYNDPRTPWFAKLFTGLVVAYAFSPIDLIPDFIPILGYLDDLVLVPLGVALSIKLIPPEVMIECRERAQTEMGKGKPVNWNAAVIIILIWILLAAVAARWVIKLMR